MALVAASRLSARYARSLLAAIGDECSFHCCESALSMKAFVMHCLLAETICLSCARNLFFDLT